MTTEFVAEGCLTQMGVFSEKRTRYRMNVNVQLITKCIRNNYSNRLEMTLLKEGGFREQLAIVCIMTFVV